MVIAYTSLFRLSACTYGWCVTLRAREIVQGKRKDKSAMNVKLKRKAKEKTFSFQLLYFSSSLAFPTHTRLFIAHEQTQDKQETFTLIASKLM